MLNAHIIRPSRSPYASPVILVPKKDNTIRMCVDFRRLNKVTVSEQWPLPRIDDIFDGLLGSTRFSTLDLKSGYYQVAVSPQSIAKTAFITPDGHYEFLRLPQNESKKLETFVSNRLTNSIGISKCLVFHSRCRENFEFLYFLVFWSIS